MYFMIIKNKQKNRGRGLIAPSPFYYALFCPVFIYILYLYRFIYNTFKMSHGLILAIFYTIIASKPAAFNFFCIASAFAFTL